MNDSDLLRIMGTDGAKWAEEFCRKFAAENTPDEGTMIGWFCNAIEAGRSAALAAMRAPEDEE
jgi:hypothetical protein